MQMLSNIFIVLAVSTLGILVEATAEQEIHENAKGTMSRQMFLHYLF
jgi:hypothetical protein